MIRQNIKGRKLAMLTGKKEARGCLVTGVRRMHGNTVSNSNVKISKVFKANISKQKLHIDGFGEVKVAVSARGIRTIRKYGGLRKFLEECKNRHLTLSAARLKKKIFGTTKKITTEGNAAEKMEKAAQD
jgi:ribosomal protein L28